MSQERLLRTPDPLSTFRGESENKIMLTVLSIGTMCANLLWPPPLL